MQQLLLISCSRPRAQGLNEYSRFGHRKLFCFYCVFPHSIKTYHHFKTLTNKQTNQKTLVFISFLFMISYSVSWEAGAVCCKDICAWVVRYFKDLDHHILDLKNLRFLKFDLEGPGMEGRGEFNYTPTGTSASSHTFARSIILDYHRNWKGERPRVTIVCKMCVHRHACGGSPGVPHVPSPRWEMSPGSCECAQATDAATRD